MSKKKTHIEIDETDAPYKDGERPFPRTKDDDLLLLMSVEEMSRRTLEHYRKIGREPLTLDEINQYIKEVREGKGEKEDV